MFAPLGGIGEIGMNLSIYGVGDGRRRQWLIVDCGVSFAAEEHLPGVDLILPDIRYLIEERRNIVGLVLTHAHEDHMGALIDLWPRLNVPLYATPFAAALFEARRLSEPGAPHIPVNVVPLGGHLELGPFAIDFINVAHSIPESNALAIRTPLGTVLHTGDWKIDPTPLIGAPTDQAKLTALGDDGVLALVGDSTNAVRDGRSPSEADVAKTLAELIRTAPARVAVTTFASHVGRIRAVADAARAAEREVVVVGRAMERVVQVARETGYLDGVQDFRAAESYGYLPPDKVLALCTGSQGEPRAALSRIAEDEHPEVTLTRGDRVIFSSRTIPGNEKAVDACDQRPGGAGRRGHHRPQPSGPRLRPPAARRTSRHDRLGAAANSDPGAWRSAASRRARQARARRRRSASAGLPQRRPGPAGAGSGGNHRRNSLGPPLQGRRAAGRRRGAHGRLAPAAALSPAWPRRAGVERKGALLADPEIELIGIPETDAAGRRMDEIARDAIDEAFEALPKPRRRDPDEVAEAVRRAVRGAHRRALEQEADLPRPRPGRVDSWPCEVAGRIVPDANHSYL